MPLTLPGGRVVDVDPVTGGEGRPTNYPTDHPPGWTPAYGAPPEIPDYISSLWESLGGDISALPNLFSLGNATNLFNYDQRMGQVQGTPGFEGVLANLGGGVQRDELDQIARLAAQRGVGFDPGAPNAIAGFLRGVGLLGSQKQALGQQQLLGLLGQFKQGEPFNVSDFFAHPDDIQAARVAANVNAGAPDPRAAADEAQRKLLEAIAAGKAAAGAGGVAPPGVDWSKLITAIQDSNKNNAPGTAVGRGPTTAVNRGTPGENISQIPYWQNIPSIRQNYVDPGVSGTPGRPGDVIQQAFRTPTYGNVGTQGGVGIDPVLNAVLGNIGSTGIQHGGGPTIENANLIPDDWSSLSDLNNKDFYNTLFGFGDTGASDIYDTLGDKSNQDFFSNIFGFGDTGSDVYDTLGNVSNDDFFNSIFGFDNSPGTGTGDPLLDFFGLTGYDEIVDPSAFAFDEYYNPA